MSGRYWLHISAVRGCLIAAALLCSIHEVHAQSNGSDQAAYAQETAAETNSIARELLSAIYSGLDKWDSVIASNESAAEGEGRKEQREIKDLKAQERMAESAYIMVGIGLLQLALSLGGIVLLAKTLRANAQSAAGALRAADAAENAVAVQRSIGEAQTRAYIAVINATLEIDEKLSYPKIRFQIRNAGNSPARQLIIEFRGGYRLDNTARAQSDFAPKGRSQYPFGTDIASGETRELTSSLTNFPLSADEINGLQNSAILIFEATVRFSFIDVFGETITDEQDWMGLIPQKGAKLPFFRVPFTGFRLMEEAKGNNQNN